MRRGGMCLLGLFCLWLVVTSGLCRGQSASAAWRGVVRDTGGKPVAGAMVELRETREGRQLISKTDAAGTFSFPDFIHGTYVLSVKSMGLAVTCEEPLVVHAGEHIDAWIEFGKNPPRLVLHFAPPGSKAQATGGQQLSNQQISDLPLNKRDFSQLLVLAAGTMTDTNGTANFTQQFAVNGQRGSTAVFAMDGVDSTDATLGGATFTNFNVDAIQEIRASSGVMPPDVGEGAASFTNVITKSGTDLLHGSVFEFVRNAAFDARNFFDRRTLALPGRIPPFIRNEFGFTNGGPVVLPGLYDGRGRTFYFGEYQAFRQVQGTTQVFPVPTEGEREGIDQTAFPGDTLIVPVSPSVAPILAGYPLPDDPQGPYGARTYSTSSKVSTFSDQFSVRVDHRISDAAQLYARFSLDDTSGPTTNPDQTAIDPSFAIRFLDHQRNAGLRYTRNISPNLTLNSVLGFDRSTPLFPTLNTTQPGIIFGDTAFDGFNSASGKSSGACGNIIQWRENVSYLHRSHNFSMGFETRWNLNTTIYGLYPNGRYTFGGGLAYSPVNIPSQSGLHNVQTGDPLPDSLSGLLTARPFSYEITAAPAIFPQGAHQGESDIHNVSYNIYFEDSWKVTPRLAVNYGLRYEVNTPFQEMHHLTGSAFFVNGSGQDVPVWATGAQEKWLVNLQPPYNTDWGGWGPRLSVEWRVTEKTRFHAGGAVITLLPLSWQSDSTVDSTPYLLDFLITALPQYPVSFQNNAQTLSLPTIYSTAGQPLYPTGHSADAPPNSGMDVLRFQQDLAQLTPSHQIQPIGAITMSKDFANGYVPTYTAGVDRSVGDIQLSAAYVATAGVRLATNDFPNAYSGASPGFAPYTTFGPGGQVLGGYGPEFLEVNSSHSTYHSLQVSLGKTSPRAGLGIQANYTLSKSLDDTSSVLGGGTPITFGNQPGSWPQDPQNPAAEKGPSTFDLRHTFGMTVIYRPALGQIAFLRGGKRGLMTGWQLLNITTLTSGPPFSVFSGVEQTGFGDGGGDRPDQIGVPVFSTQRKVREDYFGLGANNGSFFSIPINVPGGSGPNQGRFGTLGRNTFRGPAAQDFDFALLKDTPLRHRSQGEPVTLQFRAEFFNAFNLVNFGLPANILRGSGFGLISDTAGTSRQIQFSLKLLF